MSKLSPEEIADLAYQGGYTCRACGRRMSKSFCGHCDEYFNVGHAPDCPDRDRRGEEGDHVSCARTAANGWHIPSRGHFTPGG